MESEVYSIYQVKSVLFDFRFSSVINFYKFIIYIYIYIDIYQEFIRNKKDRLKHDDKSVLFLDSQLSSNR